MKYILTVFLIFLLILPVSEGSYCHQEECFTDKAELVVLDEQIVHIYYNSLFEIGENWFIIIWLEGPIENDLDLVFDFSNDNSKTLVINKNSSNYTDSLSFSGSTFNSEIFNVELNVSFNGNNNTGVIKSNSIILEIDVNKKAADDMVYLWGGMSIFWFAIGTYVLYLSNKLSDLSKKIKSNNE